MGNMVDYLVQLFFAQSFSGGRVNNRMYSNSLNFAITIAEITDSKKELSMLKDIYNNTTEDMGIPLVIIEDLVEASTSKDRNVRKMHSFYIFNKEVKYHQALKSLSDAHVRITICVTKIAKELNVDIPFDMSKYGVMPE